MTCKYFCMVESARAKCGIHACAKRFAQAKHAIVYFITFFFNEIYLWIKKSTKLLHFRSIKTVNCQGSLMEKTWMPQAGCGSFAVPATKPNKTCLLSNISEKCFIVLSKKFFLGKKCWYGMTKNTHSTLESLHSYLIWETLCLKVRNKSFFFACLPWTPHSPYAIKHVQVSSHQSGHSRILNKIWKLLREGQIMPLFPTIF